MDVRDMQRDQALDGLRGLAILLVMATHFLRLEGSHPLAVWGNAVLRSGWIGVDLFFVLSGFLITRILIRSREHPQRAGRFYLSRALRILPAYYGYLLLVLLTIALLVPHPELVSDTQRHLPTLLLFAQNLGSAWNGEPMIRELRHLWSLAIEEQFYLVWPWLLWWLRPAQVANFCLGLLGLSWACKLAMWTAGAEPMSIYYFTLSRMDGFAVGGFLAARACAGQLPMSRAWGLLPALALAVLAVGFVLKHGLPHRNDAGLAALFTSATPLVFGALLYACLRSQPRQGLRRALGQPMLQFFGRYSYGLYLVHFAGDTWVRLCLQPWAELHMSGNRLAIAMALCSLAMAVLLALLLHRLVEAPALRLKDRWLGPSSADSRATATAVGTVAESR